MKKLLPCLLLFALISSTSFSQRTINDANAEKREVPGFHGIEVSTGIQLILVQGATEDVAVSAATTEHRDKIITRVDNGILKIYYENKLGAINTRKERKELKAYVSCKNLDQLHANTGAGVTIDGVIKSTSLKIRSTTGGEIKGEINVSDLKVDQNTGSVVTLTGETGKLDVEGDTGSMFEGIDLKTGTCTAATSTGAGIYITVQKELNARANTGGYVKYKGDVGVREIKTNTGGSVKKI